MFAEPVKEIENILAKRHSWKSLQVIPSENPLADISGDMFDIRADFLISKTDESVKTMELSQTHEFGFKIHGIPVVYNPATKTLTCLDNTILLQPQNGHIKLQILVDRASIEIFGNDGRVYLPIGVILPDDKPALEVFTKGAPLRVNTMDVFELKSIW
jgi:sucrose-6-phosphate hydrolase SacC (GH32 family)